MGRLILKSRHRLLCGDSTSSADVDRLMAGERAALCFTSPPYGQQRDYQAVIDDWDRLMQGVFGNLRMADDGQVLVNLGLIHRDGEWVPYWDGWIEWMRSQGWRRFGWYVWDKLNGAIGDWNGRLRPAHEWVFHFCKVAVHPAKTVECSHAGQLLTGDGLRSKNGKLERKTQSGKAIDSHKVHDSVFRCPQSTGSVGHPAPFSVAFASDVLASWPGLTYEPFCGSGSTIIAADRLGVRCFAMELTPQYVDVAVQRFENFTGTKAVLAHG